MEFLIGAGTNKGHRKEKNQDSMAIRTGYCHQHPIAFLILCDGVGGLSRGEVASSQAVEAFLNWYEEKLPGLLCLPGRLFIKKLQKQMNGLIGRLNQTFCQEPGDGSLMATTLTALLIVGKTFFFTHVGDSRLYRVGSSLRQLTTDHNLRAVKGEAWGKNVLLQCIGGKGEVRPQFGSGLVSGNALFLLASDGFYNQLTNEELLQSFCFGEPMAERAIETGIKGLIELSRLRGEQDDLSALVVFSPGIQKGKEEGHA